MTGTGGRGPSCQRSVELMAYKPLVRQIAGRLRVRLPSSVGMDDLMQAGLIGLNEALSRFEAGRGATFETYAARRVEGAMLDELRANDTLSRDTRARLREMRAAVQRLEHRLGRAPRAKEVANELGWSLDRFHRCMVDAGAAGMRTGDLTLEGLEDAGRGDAGLGAVGEDDGDPVRALQRRQRHAALNAAFDALEEVERFVMESIYDRGLPLRDIGQALGVSESRISQMSARIVAKLRSRLREW